MSDLEPPVPKKEDELCSFILKKLKKRFAHFSQLKDHDYFESYKLDEITKLEKLENNLKRAKEVLASHIENRRKIVWIPKLTLFAILMPIILIMSVIICSDGTGFWFKIVLVVGVVFFVFLLGSAVLEGIMEKIANWKRRRNTTIKVSPENGDRNNETNEEEIDCENLKIRYQKLFEDLHENFTPIRDRYKRLCNRFFFYGVVAYIFGSMIMLSSVLDKYLSSTESSWENTIPGIAQWLSVTVVVFLSCFSVMNEIAKENYNQFKCFLK